VDVRVKRGPIEPLNGDGRLLGFERIIDKTFQAISSLRRWGLFSEGWSGRENSAISSSFQDSHSVSGTGDSIQCCGTVDGRVDPSLSPGTSSIIQENASHFTSGSKGWFTTKEQARLSSTSGDCALDSRKEHRGIFGFWNRKVRDDGRQTSVDSVPLQNIHQAVTRESKISNFSYLLQLCGISTISRSISAFFRKRETLLSPVSNDRLSSCGTNVPGLSRQCVKNFETPWDGDCQIFQSEYSNPGEYCPQLVDQGCHLCVYSSEVALRHHVIQRGRELGTAISNAVYNHLEERLLYGGSNKLSLVRDDIDILKRYYTYWGADEFYDDAVDTLRTDFEVDYADIICMFASQDHFIFISRDSCDQLIYLFNETDFNFFIMGHQDDWMEAISTFDTIIRYPRKGPRALILATRENRERYSAGWRPPPLADFGVYE
jgi:hypothetical protein